jgi:hypothetical protein
MGYEGLRPIIITSSNLNDVVNTLSGFMTDHKDYILERAEKDEDLRLFTDGLNCTLTSQDWCTMHYLLLKLSKDDPEFLRTKMDYESEHGIIHVPDVNQTGVNVQVIDPLRIDFSKVDPRLSLDEEGIRERAPYLINMDYAFGAQAKYLVRELCARWGTAIESISIMGKAGIIGGNKYDIMLPDYIIDQRTEMFVDFPGQRNHLTEDDVKMFFDGTIHSGGPFLTVPGTSTQNQDLNEYYRQAYGIIGLEMEARHYLQGIETVFRMKDNRLCDDIMVNAGYWASDNPQKRGESLGAEHMEGGCVPANALCLAILNKVLNEGQACFDRCGIDH